MKNIFKISTIALSLLFVISCGDEDLEPVLALDKDTETGIQSVDDLKSVLNSAYNRMTPSGYYGRDVLVMGEVRFYLVAILFIIFDLEIAFLFPWAISLGNIGLLGFSSMMIFLFILTIGFIYEWKKGALDWE